MATFALSKPTTPVGEVVRDYTFWDVPDEPVFQVRTTADPNHQYRNGLMAKANRGRGKIRGNQRENYAEIDKVQNEIDMDLFPKHVIVGWDRVNDPDGSPVEFNEANCRQLLGILDSIGQFDPLRAFCMDVTNFYEDALVDPSEAAGNSPPVSPGS